MTTRPHPSTVALIGVIDLLMLILFAAIGRRSHDEGTPLLGTLEVAAPFLIAYVVCAAATGLWRAPYSLRRAALTWAPTVALGMVLRRTLFDRGTATSFMVVAFIATAVLLLGWRLIAWFVRRPVPAE